MGNSRSSEQLQPEDLSTVQEETGFTPQQIERLYSRREKKRSTNMIIEEKNIVQLLYLVGRLGG